MIRFNSNSNRAAFFRFPGATAWLSVWLLFLASCSQYSQKPASVAFHNLSAHYNAYFIAKANLDSAEWNMSKAYEENYNQLMPILLPLDSTLALPSKKHLEDVIQKASIVAEKHQNSKWLDNSYTLLGKARLYLGQWEDGIEALRYVYAKGQDDNDKNEALIVLMRAYAERKEFANALSVSDYLRQQPLTSNARIDFYLTKAYLHQKAEEYLTAVAILEEALPLLKKSPQKARVHYIAGQLYDQLQRYSLANQHYAKVPKNKPGYDLSFFARMNSLQNRVLLNPRSTIEAVGFQKMLKDRKNADLKDKIYFTMGMLAEGKGDYPQALDYLQRAAKSGGGNVAQIPYTYMEMARIYLDKMEQYEPAKAYYDSALAVLPARDPAFSRLSSRKTTLDEFVAQMTIIRTEDSLQRLAGLAPEVLKTRIDEIIEKIQQERKAAYEKEVAALNAARKTGSNSAAPVSGPRWQLYDPAQISQGKSEFMRKWGNRRLEDDWRRQNKTNRSVADANTSPGSAPDSAASAAAIPGFKEISRDSEAWLAMHEDLKRTIPLSDSAKAASHMRKETALYSLGKIYRTSFKESRKAVDTFNRLLGEYPETEYRQEVYYLMYLCLPEDDPQRESWKNKLIAEYPNSTYVRFLGPSVTGKPASPASQVYENIYSLYLSGKTAEALSEVDKALPVYRDSPIADRFALLRLFIIGKSEGVQAYRAAILEFMRLYPESQYIPRTREMLTVADQAALLPRN